MKGLRKCSPPYLICSFGKLKVKVAYICDLSLFIFCTARPGREQEIVDEENFKSYDTNNDGRLDRREIRFWVLPDRYSMAEEEAEHLLSETDADRDGKLTFEEILNRHDLWVGSAATDFGDGLHDPAEL